MFSEDDNFKTARELLDLFPEARINHGMIENDIGVFVRTHALVGHRRGNKNAYVATVESFVELLEMLNQRLEKMKIDLKKPRR